MKRRTLFRVYVAATAAVLFIGLPLYLMAYHDPGFFWSFVMRWSLVLVCLAVLMSYYFPWFRLGVVEIQPRESIMALTRMLRTMGYDVERRQELLEVKIDKSARLKIRARDGVEGTKLAFQVGTTPLSTAVIVVLFLIVPPVSIILSLLAVRASFKFVDEKLANRLFGLQAVASAPMDVRSTLVDSLSEGHRLAEEAYDSAKSNYEDAVIVLIIIGIALSFGVFAAGLGFIPADSGSTRMLYSAVLAVLVSVGFVLPVFARTRARQVFAIRQFKGYEKRLGDALALELSSQKPPDGYPSSFEIIAGTGGQIPLWLAARRRAGMYRHPATWIAIFVFAYSGLLLTIVGLADVVSGSGYPVLDGVLFVTGGSMLVSTVLLYLHWREEERLEIERVTADWKGRLETLGHEMEKYLQGL